MYKYTGYIYYDPSGRKIVVLGRCGLLSETHALVEREDGVRWSVKYERLEAVLGQE